MQQRCRCKGPEVQVQRCTGAHVVVQRCRGADEVGICRGAEVRRCRGGEDIEVLKRCRGDAEMVPGAVLRLSRGDCVGSAEV